ncbi:MAG: hypothetical protein WCK47_03100 [bacterium]
MTVDLAAYTAPVLAGGKFMGFAKLDLMSQGGKFFKATDFRLAFGAGFNVLLDFLAVLAAQLTVQQRHEVFTAILAHNHNLCFQKSQVAAFDNL